MVSVVASCEVARVRERLVVMILRLIDEGFEEIDRALYT